MADVPGTRQNHYLLENLALKAFYHQEDTSLSIELKTKFFCLLRRRANARNVSTSFLPYGGQV